VHTLKGNISDLNGKTLLKPNFLHNKNCHQRERNWLNVLYETKGKSVCWTEPKDVVEELINAANDE